MSATANLLNHRYRILKALAEGGFGKTFLVEDTQMPSRRQCVIKQLKPMNEQPEVFRIVKDRFSREAAVLEAVGKGNSQIPDLYAYFEEEGQFYLVQEWIEGEPLVNLVQEDWSEERVRSLLTKALQALANVHRQNIIHRDIKPDNIILRKSDSLPCLIDFGAVKELMSTVVRQSGATQSSLVIGTPGFMPPEQAAGRPTFSSDLYSLGMTMIFLLTKRSPAELPTNSHMGEVLWQQFAPDVSDHFANILSRAVHPYTQNRYPTAADMLAALPTNTLQPKPTTLEQPVVASSQVPTVAAAHAASPEPLQPIQQSIPQGAPQPIAQPTVTTGAQPAPLSTHAKPSGLPWKQIGLAAGGLLLGVGILLGVRPKLSFEESTSVAEATNFPEVIQALENTLEEQPNDTATKVELANNYHKVGEYDKAVAQADTVLAEDTENAAALLVKGKIQLDTGKYQDAITTLTAAADSDRKDAEALVERGNVYYEIGEYDKAVDDYRNALQRDSNYGRAYKEWASVNAARGNNQEALQNLNLAIENGDQSISAYTSRGNRKSELGDRAGAAEDWKVASKMTASTASDYASRGFAKSRLNRKDEALDDYNQALIVNPNSVQSIINDAYLKYESGEKEQALRTLERALTVNPNSTTALIMDGEIRSNSYPADQEGAIASYSKALAVNPNDPNILNNRCTAYFSVQKLDLALTDCDRGLQINPRSEALYLARGNIRLTQENFNGAIQDYSRTLKIIEERGGDPFRESIAYSNRSSARFNLQDINGALDDINKAIERNPGDASDLYKRGILKSSVDDNAGAREDLQQAADIYLAQGNTANYNNVLATIEQLEL